MCRDVKKRVGHIKKTMMFKDRLGLICLRFGLHVLSCGMIREYNAKRSKASLESFRLRATVKVPSVGLGLRQSLLVNYYKSAKN